MGPPFLRLRKLYAVVYPKIKDEAPPPISEIHHHHHHQQQQQQQYWLKTNHNTDPNGWRCVDRCCWMIGYTCTVWWAVLLLYSSLLHTDVAPDQSPGSRLRREGLRPLHPVVMVPGIANGGLELWEGRPCSEGLFRKRIWGGNFVEIFKRPRCWLEHMSLDNETGLDPEGIRVRAVPGLVAADYFTPGYFVWAVLIKNLARIGYEGKNMHMTAYDWRLSFQNTEVRDQSLSRLKSKIELMVRSNGNKKVVVVPHSMGVLYFLHFLKWVEAPPPMGGGGGSQWCAKHIKAIMNISPTFLGVPKAVSGIFSAEAKDIAFARAMAPGILDSGILGLRALEHIMQVSRTWDSIISLLPKGGETIWGNLDWSPEQGYPCDPTKKRFLKSSLTDRVGLANSSGHGKLGLGAEETVHYGRIISFGKMASELPSSKLSMINYKDLPLDKLTQGRSASEQVWTEYNEMNFDSIKTIVENKVYTTKTIPDLFRSVAPKLMRRADAHFSHGIADDLDDPKYSHYKYWSNPLETKLPDAPEMEIHCLYGVGIPTERSYVYKLSPSLGRCKTIPFRIDGSADGSTNGGCLKGGVYTVDGDQSVPVLSAGFMCAKGWRGRNRFNPSGVSTNAREYLHKAPASVLEGRGMESGAHVDIMGNVGLIEDLLRVAAGASGIDLGGDRIHSNVMKISEQVKIRL